MTSSLLKLPERQALERNRQYMYPSDEETDNDNGDFSDQEDGFDDREIERSYPVYRSEYEEPQIPQFPPPKPPKNFGLPIERSQGASHRNLPPPLAQKPGKPLTKANLQSDLQAALSNRNGRSQNPNKVQTPVFPGVYDKAHEAASVSQPFGPQSPGPMLHPRNPGPKHIPVHQPPSGKSQDRFSPNSTNVPNTPSWRQPKLALPSCPPSPCKPPYSINYNQSQSNTSKTLPSAPSEKFFHVPPRTDSFRDAVEHNSFTDRPALPMTSIPTRNRLNQAAFFDANDRPDFANKFKSGLKNIHATLKRIPVGIVKPSRYADQSPPNLSGFPWYHSSLNREQAEYLLNQYNADGVFLVRDFTHDKPDVPFTISIRYRGINYHVQVRQKSNGYFALGKEKLEEEEFISMEKLINHYRDHPVLIAPSSNPNGPAISTRLGPLADRNGFC